MRTQVRRARPPHTERLFFLDLGRFRGNVCGRAQPSCPPTNARSLFGRASASACSRSVYYLLVDFKTPGAGPA
jgi:hypothetical protein